MTRPRTAHSRALLVGAAWLLASAGIAPLAPAQPSDPAQGSTPDTTRTNVGTEPAPTAPTEVRRTTVRSTIRIPGEERDRVELGAAVPHGFFDVLGSIGYRRLIRIGGPFEQSLQLELSGGAKDYISEGALSLYFFLRPIATYKPEWKLRPLFEVGPGAHLTVQVADIEGFSESSFHLASYLKTHAYGGLEVLLSRKLGIVVRGRVSVPEHHPFDYAQAAIFLR